MASSSDRTRANRDTILVSALLPHVGQAGGLAPASTPTSALNRFPQSSHVYSKIGIAKTKR
jgi:hypothetical protein